ncbi:hypothetical protein AALA79_21630 [Lachnospiraceae bacterium 64-25]
MDSQQVIADPKKVEDGKGGWIEAEKAYYQSVYILVDDKCNFLEANYLISSESSANGYADVNIDLKDGWRDGSMRSNGNCGGRGHRGLKDDHDRS